MKITTYKNMVNVTLGVTMEQLKQCVKYKPEIVKLYDEDETLMYQLFVADSGKIAHDYAMVSPVGDELAIWVEIPNCTYKKFLEDKSAYVLENYGLSLSLLKRLENQIIAGLNGVEEMVESLRSDIVEE